jgi:hypothetical protein
MTEVWRDVPGYVGLYQVSNTGRVRNARSGRVLKLNKQGRGYAQTMLSKGGQRSYPLVHRLVAMVFIPNPENKPQINHINGDKGDNRVENLEWCTSSENLYHRYQVLGQSSGRTRPVICESTGEVYPSAKSAAAALGLNRTGVTQVCNGKQKTTKKQKFKYLEE